MKSFLTACGLVDPLQLIVESQSAEGGELRLLHQPFALIGRDPRADLVLEHPRVSRRHVYFQVIDGRAFWVDLESRTGTRLDEASQQSGWLEGGRTLCVGPYIIRRFVGDSPIGNDPPQGKPPLEAPVVAMGNSRGSLPEVTLEFLNGPSQAPAWPVRRVMSLVGSASGCKFRLTDPSVSRFHGSFLRTSAGLWIVDLLGHGGITVNEVPVRFSHLTDGDLLRIGRYQIRVRCRLERQGSAKALPNRAGAKAFTRLSRRERVSNGFKSPEWAAAVVPFVPATDVANRAQFPLAIPALSSLTDIAMPASEAKFPLNLTPSESTASMLVPLINQFGFMQQQMFDQFQQAMAMMVQMFGTMHREQMEMIRTELDGLRDLTEEFHSLKKELESRTQERNTTVSSAPTIAPAASKPAAAEPPTDKFQDSGLCSQAKMNGTSDPANSERDSIVWLHQRIMTLQHERETRWQKILKLLPGVS